MNTTEPIAPVSFSVSADTQSFIDAAQAVARDVDMDAASQRDSAASQQHALQAVTALHVDALLESLTAEEGDTALLHVAHALGAARPEAAWQGLLAALEKPLWQALGEPFASARAGRIAWPVTPDAAPNASRDAAPRWVCWTPALSDGAMDAICLLQADGERMTGPCTLADLKAAFDVQVESPVLGLPTGLALWIRPKASTHGASGAGMPLHAPGVGAAARRRHQVLLTGLLAGMTQRASLVAYAYAKTRQSGGRPIMQHQAVALRLADIAMNQQALWLYVQACFGGDKAGMRLSISHVHELASRVTRDAVQVAAAHGFVEGLPFKRLFEQTRTVLTALRATAPAQAL